ncbi:MAG: YraN family protein [Alphaproteobacteria bacterium]|nr:YraN family protein [Alphaproteobacteria bacterium]
MIRTTYQKGLYAEGLCRLALRLKGYRILAVRYKTPLGEIDIVATRGNIVAAVEVKARRSHEDALQALSVRQQGRIIQALEMFIARHPSFGRADLRLDVMLVRPRHWPKHIPNAWQKG